MYINDKYIRELFSILNSSGVNYVLIKNINDELPYALENGKDIDILVHENDIALIEKVMVFAGFQRTIHPLGNENGWKFAYQLPEFQFWKKHSIDQDLYVDISFKLCCKGIMPGIWIPLDETINLNIWERKLLDNILNCWRMDYETQLCYLIIRSIFDKNEFSVKYIEEIQSMKYLLSSERVYSILKKVFFKYTDRLIFLIKENQYKNIIPDFIKYNEY